jgi:hypothetical protein
VALLVVATGLCLAGGITTIFGVEQKQIYHCSCTVFQCLHQTVVLQLCAETNAAVAARASIVVVPLFL